MRRLLVFIGVGVLTLTVAACDKQVQEEEDAQEFTVQLEDGRVLHCVWVVEGAGQSLRAGMDCEGWE